MDETSFDEVFDIVLVGYGFAGAVAEGMAEAEDYLRDLVKGSGAEIATRPRGGNYPFPHREAFYYSHVETIANFDPRAFYPQVRGRNAATLEPR